MATSNFTVLPSPSNTVSFAIDGQVNSVPMGQTFKVGKV